MVRQMLVDTKSYELAQHFLADEKNVRPEEYWALASDIQYAVESYMHGRQLEQDKGSGHESV